VSWVHLGSSLVIWILGADILFLWQIQYLVSLFHYLITLSTLETNCVYSLWRRIQHSILVYIPLHITNLLSSHSIGGFGYILLVEHCDYKVLTKSCMPGLLGGSALVLENPVSQIYFWHFLPIWKHCTKPCSILWIWIILAFLKSHNIIFNNLPN